MAEDAKKEFIKLYTTNIKREGADKLLEWLCDKSDFFEAPASSKYHNAFEGGLCAHSLNVARRLKLLVDTEKKLCPDKESVTHITDESVIICGLLHDICKANFYKVDFRNKKEDGEWVRVPYYTIDEELPYGHGEHHQRLHAPDARRGACDQLAHGRLRRARQGRRLQHKLRVREVSARGDDAHRRHTGVLSGRALRVRRA